MVDETQTFDVIDADLTEFDVSLEAGTAGTYVQRAKLSRCGVVWVRRGGAGQGGPGAGPFGEGVMT